jgi:hypothetical protein
MRTLVVTIIAACFLWQPRTYASPPPQEQTKKTQQQSSHNQGDANSPLSASVGVPATKTNNETAYAEQSSKDVSAANWWIVRLTVVYLFLVAFQLVVFGLQANRLRETIRTMDRIAQSQGADTRASIEQATRSAGAMERVAEAMALTAETNKQISELTRERWSQQMRAYITVLIGNATFQDRTKGVHFQANPEVFNAGATPAYKVSYRMRVGIEPSTLSPDVELPALPKGDNGELILGQHQNLILMQGSVLESFIPDQDVESIMRGSTDNSLCVWGEVTYEDIFGKSHKTTFCQSLFWLLPDNRIFGIYAPGRNRAD